MRTISIYFLVFFILAAACKKSVQEDAPALATVGKSNLTIADLKSMLPQSGGLELSVVQVQNFVQRWTEKELVFQHAVAQGFLQNPEIQRKLRELERDYIYALYIQRFVDDKVTVSEEEVSAYYREHPEEFIRQESQYDLQLLMVNNFATANECVNRITGGEDFGTVARENSLDESKSREGKIGWSNLSGLPDDVRRRVPTLTPRTVSQPIQTPIGFYVVKVLGVRPRGEKQSLDEARDLIQWKIKAYKREDEYKELIRQLKDNSQVTNNWELLDLLEISK